MIIVARANHHCGAALSERIIVVATPKKQGSGSSARKVENTVTE